MGMRAAERRVAELVAEGRRWNEQDARDVLAAWDASGESGTEFGRRLGVDPQRLWWWRSRLRNRAATSFAPVEVRGSLPAAVVTTSDGARIEVATVDAASAEWTATVVVALRERGS
jgi:transposase-like protein